MLKLVLTVLFITLRAGIALAQTTGPATAPTTSPVDEQAAAPAMAQPKVEPVPTDGSTPRSALKFYFIAQQDGDIRRIKDSYHADGGEQQEMLDARIDMHVALVRLHKAVEGKLGVGIVHYLRIPTTRPAMPLAVLDEMLAQGSEQIDGDRATLAFGPREIRLVRSDGKWRIDIASDLNDKTPEQLLARTRAYNEVAQEVEQGKHMSPPSVSDRLYGLLEQYDPTRAQPATAPTTVPTPEPQVEPQAAPITQP